MKKYNFFFITFKMQDYNTFLFILLIVFVIGLKIFYECKIKGLIYYIITLFILILVIFPIYYKITAKNETDFENQTILK
jgi:hypothetical protein